MPDVSARASESLLARKETFAQSITAALYEAHPEWTDLYGEAGRAKCHQDMRYTLEHLVPSVALSEPRLFVQYVTWLVDVLGARGIPADHVRASLIATRDALAAQMPSAESEAVGLIVSAGLRSLDTHSST